jgi:hypothetical protein
MEDRIDKGIMYEEYENDVIMEDAIDFEEFEKRMVEKRKIGGIF